MYRRQYYLTVLFGIIFQIFFSTIHTQTLDENQFIESTGNNSTNKCEPASIDEFPKLFFTHEQRRRGGVLVHIALILYSFAAIEIVCDDYFASALEKISYNLNLTPVRNERNITNYYSYFFFLLLKDVAGATFMALATSASEFFTSIVGVFFVKSDIACKFSSFIMNCYYAEKKRFFFCLIR